MLVLHLRSRLPGPSRLAWQGAARLSRTLRAAARWPLAILDRRPTPRPGEGRSGRRDGLPALTKGYSDARRHLVSALTHSVFKRGNFIAYQPGTAIYFMRADIKPGLKVASDVVKRQNIVSGGLGVDNAKDKLRRLALKIFGGA